MVQIWSFPSGDRRECGWAGAALRIPGAEVPIRGFGSSECSCPAHPIHFLSQPDPRLFARLIGLPSPELLQVEVPVKDDNGELVSQGGP